jgi:type IV pilus assembly protein PilQ
MEGFLRKIILGLALAAFVSGCTLGPVADEASSDQSEFSDFDKGADQVAADDTSTTEATPEDTLEQELSETKTAPAQQEAKKEEDFAQFEEQVPPPQVEPEPVPVVEAAPPPVLEEPTPVEPPPVVTEEVKSRPVTIQRLQFKGNDSGGTLAIEADGPLNYSTRVNPSTNQFIVEIQNSVLSRKAKRPLNTKDFPGGIGSIDPYQAPGSTVSRIVIQLRPGAQEPVLQAEGNALLVVSGSAPMATPQAGAAPTAPGVTGAPGEAIPGQLTVGTGEEAEVPSKILSSSSLREFMSGNQQFYGKKISFEANDADIRDIFKFLSDESGVNLIISEEVTGKISVRFKQVPWDQALVVLMNAKKLGYVRQGQILRISKMTDIKQEEEDFTKAAKAKQALLPLQVKMIPVSYAKVDDIAKQVTPFLSERGKVIAEPRTSSVVISDIDDAIDRVQKLIVSLDTPPAQVLIEGKIVEATDTFQRFIGLNWSASGDSVDLGTNSKGNATQMNLGLSNGISGGSNLNLSITQLDFLGNLTAALGLGESTGELRVLSSPRILTLHNEPAEINQSSELPLITAVTSPTGAINNTVTFKQVRLKLNVTPQVTNDASVILAVDMTREFPGPVSDRASGARPINSRTAKTKVIVRNGQTAVIGGIYQSDSTESENHVPGLSNIPVFGWLFKNKNSDRQKNELLIFLTPRIVGQADSGISAPVPMAPTTPKASVNGDEGLEL